MITCPIHIFPSLSSNGFYGNFLPLYDSKCSILFKSFKHNSLLIKISSLSSSSFFIGRSLFSSKQYLEFSFILLDQVYFLFVFYFFYSMTIIVSYDENIKKLITLSAREIKDLWDFYVRGYRDTLTQADFDHFVKEAYDDITASFSNSDSDSSSSGSSLEVLMEITESFVQEVMSYDHNSIDEVEITKLWSLKNVSSIGNEDDVILEPCILGECVS